jgi:hypothetical protein
MLVLWLGVEGMRRLGRWSRGLAGPWRPGAAGAALIAILAGAGLIARGAVYEGAALLAAAGAVSMIARWRTRPSPSAEPPVRGSDMTESEARSMLGVDSAAGPEEIERAYKRLMLRVHPDLGGAGGLAAQLNAARAALLRTAEHSRP